MSMKDSPNIPLIGHGLTGKAVHDPEIMIREGDVIRVTPSTDPADDMFFLVNGDGNATATSGRKRRQGNSYEFESSVLVDQQ